MDDGAPNSDCRPMAPSFNPEGSPPRTLHVVLADDSEIFRRTLGEFLVVNLGLTVVAEAQDGEAAIAAVQHAVPDLVLMDVKMPGLGGLETTRQLKAASDCPWVVLLPLGDSENLRDAAAAAGADGVLLKGQIAEQLPALLSALSARRPH